MNTCVVGLQFGDEGKGKISNMLSDQYDCVVRYNGGANAGHTVVVNGVSSKHHLLPSGGIHRILTHGMVIDPLQLMKEMKSIHPDVSVYVSDKAHVVMPWHIAADARKGGKIGTTARGIGPTYADKMHRWNAIRMGDLLEKLKGEKMSRFFAVEQALYKGIVSLHEEYREAAEWLQPYIRDTARMLREVVKDDTQQILFESANGMMLDVDFGTYPYVTSSAVGPAAIPQACGLPNLHLDRIIGVIKVYSTRVGEGPFPSEICSNTDPIGCCNPDLGGLRCHDKNEEIFSWECSCDWCVSHKIREQGGEYGTTTGRPRRIGWLDLDIVKYSVENTAATELALMHVDTLYGFKKVGVLINNTVKFVLGWDSIEDSSFKDYIKMIEDYIEIPVNIISYGPDRKDTWVRVDKWIDS